MQQKILTIFVLSVLILSGCSKEEANAPKTNSGVVLSDVSSGKVGAYVTTMLGGSKGLLVQSRPSATMGVFASLYLSQGSFQPVLSARTGIEAQLKLLSGQVEVQSSEVFSLMKEYGSILQIDVIDMLNRSTRRDESLDEYMKTLRNLTDLMKRKEKEMDTTVNDLEDQRRDQRKTVQGLERIIKSALRDEDYEIAGANQEELASAKAKLTEIETKIGQTKDMRERFGSMIRIGENRIIAIVRNRRIILAGLKVVEVPGIDEFELIDDSKKSRKRNLDILETPDILNEQNIATF